ncbi:hypothetical protein Bcav_2108 [Beutenbergia cavernae DSM 12333]|uniref:Uncharacterized protein n=1 Tax=Beutenbergia cavernae (strain ATCC BAA-8 / DSM 12333 / CCUG 43141 / JCM 11478 / NBRC 16432 / NCIMB 13614 / HKI 0122) TaxID=471853 RepID=C5C6F5_BEUC1|nr:hypothetical protein [Beutenbergia cavernae]ACQ80361.1 hypothetical protein Bcav_2108 [Beutenbergia cavernae DSM 12333]
MSATPPEPTEPPELELRVLEEDETVPPRPEEEIADAERSETPPGSSAGAGA